MVHIAGLDVQVGPLLRQRCAYCDVILIDADLRNVAVAVPPGTDPAEVDTRPATWAVGDLVLVDGGYSSTVEHVDGDPLPLNACVPLEVGV